MLLKEKLKNTTLLPSVKDFSKEKLNTMFEKQNEMGSSKIKVGDLMTLEVPNIAIQDARKYLLKLDKKERKRILKYTSKKIRILLSTIKKTKMKDDSSDFRNLLDDTVVDLVIQEASRQLSYEMGV